jgi:proteasome assembly chaperone (PAC2) family protein
MSNYVFTVGGEVKGEPHKPGDPVPAATSKRKIAEWLRAGVIEEEDDDGTA